MSDEQKMNIIVRTRLRYYCSSSWSVGRKIFQRQRRGREIFQSSKDKSERSYLYVGSVVLVFLHFQPNSSPKRSERLGVFLHHAVILVPPSQKTDFHHDVIPFRRSWPKFWLLDQRMFPAVLEVLLHSSSPRRHRTRDLFFHSSRSSRYDRKERTIGGSRGGARPGGGSTPKKIVLRRI